MWKELHFSLTSARSSTRFVACYAIWFWFVYVKYYISLQLFEKSIHMSDVFSEELILRLLYLIAKTT